MMKPQHFCHELLIPNIRFSGSQSPTLLNVQLNIVVVKFSLVAKLVVTKSLENSTMKTSDY